MSPASVPTMSVDLSSLDVNRNPFPHMNAVREEAPAVYNPLIDHWMVGRWDETRQMLGDEAGFAQDRKFFDDIFGIRLFIAQDNPEHNQNRSTWNRPFRRAEIERLSDMVSEVVDEVLAPVLGALERGETLDVVEHTNAIAPIVIAHVLGIARDDIPRFSEWSHGMLGIAESVVEGQTERGERLRETGFAATEAMCAFAGAELEKRRREQRDDDLIGLMALAPTAAHLTEEERCGHVALLTMGGHETTSKLIGQLLVIMAQHPDQRAAIRQDRSLATQAIEEVVRYAGVIGAAVRSAREDTEIGGVPIPAGAQIFGLPTAANRDPRRWENPDTFDIFREPKPHIGFGFGTHSCLGMNLARLEASAVLNYMLDNAADYELTGGRIDYGTNWFLRGPTAVSIRF